MFTIFWYCEQVLEQKNNIYYECLLKGKNTEISIKNHKNLHHMQYFVIFCIFDHKRGKNYPKNAKKHPKICMTCKFPCM